MSADRGMDAGGGTAPKRLKVASAFELPQRLGVLQRVEYLRPPPEWCTPECPYEGVLTAEGCKRGICVKYRAQVLSRDGVRWAPPRRRREDREAGGCLKQQAADALWDLAERGIQRGGVARLPRKAL